jgi:hypothetical protein
LPYSPAVAAAIEELRTVETVPRAETWNVPIQESKKFVVIENFVVPDLLVVL